jgi:hypothetical protein
MNVNIYPSAPKKPAFNGKREEASTLAGLYGKQEEKMYPSAPKKSAFNGEREEPSTLVGLYRKKEEKKKDECPGAPLKVKLVGEHGEASTLW